MKNCFFVFLFLTALAGNAQTQPAFGVYYSPSFTSRITRANSDLNWSKKQWDKLESGGVGFAVGALAERTFSSKLSLRGGVGFSTFVERVDSLKDLGIDKCKTDYRFFEMPVVASYYFGEKKSRRSYFSVGYTLNYFLNKSITYSLVGSNRDERIVIKGDVNSLNHALRIAMGLDIILDKKWNLRTELFTSQFLTSLTQGGVKRYPTSFGISLQIRKN